MWQEFKKFAVRGNVIDLAVGVIIGAAFTAIVNSLVNDIIMPPLGFVLGRIDFSNFFIDLSGHGYASISEAQKAGAATINYGLFINNVIKFLITAGAVFVLVREMNRLFQAQRGSCGAARAGGAADRDPRPAEGTSRALTSVGRRKSAELDRQFAGIGAREAA